MTVHVTRSSSKPFSRLCHGRIEVWGPAHLEHNEYLRVFMRNLRHKLEEDPALPRMLVTETGVGYRLVSS